MKKKLLFIINTMGRAGAETALVTLLKKLDSMGEFDISLYTIIPRGELFASVPKNIHILNHRVSCGSVLSMSGRTAIFFRTFYSFFYHLSGLRLLPYMCRNIVLQKKSGHFQFDKLLWRLLAEGVPEQNDNYDLAVAFIEGASAYYLAKKVRAAHKAAFIHIDYNMAGYTPMMDQNCYDCADRIFAVSKEAGQKFIDAYPKYSDKVMLFRNILDKDEIARKAEMGCGFTDGFEGIRLLTVGRLVYQKGYDIAIEALAQLIKCNYNVRWYVLGEGPQRKFLEHLIKKYKVSESFVLLGATDNPYPYIKQADIYVQATRFEGKSCAVEEAQILNKPIVASDCTGNREQIIPDYDGILFPLGTENLVNTLKRVLNNPNILKVFSLHTEEKTLIFPDDLNNLLELI